MITMDYVTDLHVATLQNAGYEIFEAIIYDSAPGHIVVADPILCMSGSAKWAEVRRVTLRSAWDVARFINTRS